jgi:Tfp pilus assembly protein PilF
MPIKTIARRIACAALLGLPALSHLTAEAAPYLPKSDAEVVERLPGRASDPAVRQVESLRKQLAARPDDAGLRVDIARRYFEMAMAQGDPRYVGYASSALAPLAGSSSASASYWTALGLIQQFSHDFEKGLASLAKASQLDPSSPEPLLWRAAILMVEARYTEALAECERLKPIAAPALTTGCLTYAQATTGQLQPAFDDLSATVKAAGGEAPEILLWQYNRLAEMAARLQQNDVAEKYFRSALRIGITDQFLLGAYSDFLLARQRSAEVIKLLSDWERSDVLLLRLALAGKAAKHPRAADWASQLRDRFQAAALRGDRLHEQEAARFELDIEGDARKALALASSNYQIQKEPRDAEILMRAALAAGEARAAQPALDWLRDSHYEDPALTALAGELAAKGAKR